MKKKIIKPDVQGKVMPEKTRYNPKFVKEHSSDLDTVIRFSNREFRIWTFIKFKSINSKLNLAIYMLLILLSAVLGVRLI